MTDPYGHKEKRKRPRPPPDKLIREGCKPRKDTHIMADQEENEQEDKVNHPSYYGGEDNPYETIKVLEAKLTPEEFKGFCKGNAIKYLDRAKGKDGGEKEIQDYGKSVWYLTRMNEAIKRQKERDENN